MKTVLITGCSSGFGRGMVDEFLARGWGVIATLRHAETRQSCFEGIPSVLIPTSEEPPGETEDAFAPLLEDWGDRCRLAVMSLDVTCPEARDRVTRFIQSYTSCHGPLHALVNNAGYGLFGALEDLSESQLRDQMEVNFFGAALLTRSLLPALRAAQGTVIFISSTFGYMGFPLTSAYCASKFALEGFAESLAYELRPHGVRVALIEPGASRSNFGKNGQWGAEPSLTYAQQTQSYGRLRTRLKANARAMAPVVARHAANLAEGRDRRLRVQVGRDGAIAHAFYRLIPRPMQYAVLHRMYHRLFSSQESP